MSVVVPTKPNRRIWPLAALGLSIVLALVSIAPHLALRSCAEFDCAIDLLAMWFVTFLAVLPALAAAFSGRRQAGYAMLFMLVLTLANLADAVATAWIADVAYFPAGGPSALTPERIADLRAHLGEFALFYMAIPAAGLLAAVVIFLLRSTKRPSVERPGKVTSAAA